MRQVEQFATNAIAALSGRRPINTEAVKRIAESMRSMGLRTPITVRIVDDFVDVDGVLVDGQPVLVTGAHRLAAAKELGWEKIECFVFDGDDEIDAKLWEIAENLHRAELSTLERSEQIAEWVRLMDEKREKATLQSAQVEPNESKREDGRGHRERDKVRHLDAVSDKPCKGGRGKEGGIRAASRDLGINESSARRAVKISSITAEAKARAIEYGIDTQTALERIARADDQLAEVERIEDERVERERLKAASHSPKPTEPDPEDYEEPEWTDKETAELDGLLAAWEQCSLPVRRDFINGNWPFVKQILADSGRL